jgi:hypothetical protein
MSESFEAIKYALRQSKDGVVVSFVVHPSDVSPALMALAVGARVQVEWAEIGDDEKPVVKPPQAAVTEKPKRKFHEMSLAQQCATRCKDIRFHEYLQERWPFVWEHENGNVAKIVREELHVESRSELGKGNHDADNLWRELEADYQQWQTDRFYAESVR